MWDQLFMFVGNYLNILLGIWGLFYIYQIVVFVK